MNQELISQPASGASKSKGRPRALSIEQEAALQAVMRTARPHELGLGHPAWSRAAIKDLIAAKTGQILDRRSVDTYVTRWGFDRKPAYKTALEISPDRTARWLDTEYRALSTRIGRQKGRLRWLAIIEIPSIATQVTQASKPSTGPESRAVEVRLESGNRTQWTVCNANDADALRASILHMLSLDSEYEQTVIVVNCLPTSIDELLVHAELIKNRVLIKEVFGKTERISAAKPDQEHSANESSRSIDLATTEQQVILLDGCLCLTYQSRSSGKRVDWSLNLGKFWLPPTPFSDQPIRLSEEPKLCELMVASANEFLTSTGWGKSIQNSLGATCTTLAKLFEWSWINGIYDPTRLAQSQFDALLLQLSTSGWVGALKIEERVKINLEKGGPSVAEEMLCEQRSRASASISSKCQSILGTCITAREMANVKQLIVSAAGRANVRERTPSPRWQGSSRGMGYSMLRQALTSMNLLAGFETKARLPFVPYPNTRKLAEKYGRQGGRTPNLLPEHVGQLLLKSMKLVRDVGPPLARLLGEYIDKIESSSPRPERFKANPRLLRSCQSYAQTVQAIGWDITRWSGNEDGSDESDTSLNVLIRDIYTACCTVIIFLNARRRDEIQHAEIGLYKGTLRPLDSALDLYIADFYIEKSLEDYATFLVSDFTVEAIQLLEQLSGLARRWRQAPELSGEGAKGHTMLLELPNLLPAGREQRLMFSYECNKGSHAYHFVTSALGAEIAKIFGPHMGRRAYALIYHYRYEHGTLLALAQQFGSVFIDRVLTYVTDGPHQQGGFKAHQLGGKATGAMRNNLKEVQELEGELELVAKERVEELVSKVLLSGKAHGGPFQKLILRFHQKLVGRVEYKLSESKNPVKTVATALIDRGHRSTPYPHGNCYARMNAKGGQARCKDADTGMPDAANASLRTCTGCPYHDYQAAHLQATEEFIGIKIQQMMVLSDSSVQAAALRKEIEEDQQYLEMRKRRLGLIA